MVSKVKHFGRRLTASPAVVTAMMLFITLVFWETLLHLVAYGGFHWRFCYTIGFCGLAAMLLSMLCTMWTKPTVNRVAFYVVLAVGLVLYGSQLIYHQIFGGFYSLSLVHMGGKAVQAFWKETVASVIQNTLLVLALLIPVIASFRVRKIFPRAFQPVSRKSGGKGMLIWLVCHGILLLSLFLGGRDFYSPFDLYWSNDVSTEQSVETFGIGTTLRLEIQHALFGKETAEQEVELQDDAMVQEEIEEDLTDAAQKAAEDAEPLEQILSEPETLGANVDASIDFEALNTLTEDEAYLTLNQYFAEQTPTNKNAYTGYFEGYNLIMICAESFSPGAIDPELTPTLYQMATGGFVFRNYYNTFPNVTTNGEYSFCTGLYPDLSRSKSDASFYASRNSELPYCMGNVFAQQLGVQSWAYHNYLGSYYNRDQTHPNMGYRFVSAGNGMTFTSSWPASDLEMFEQSVDDYIGQEPFHAYYMTFSGHYKYDRNNPIAAKNFHLVEDLEGYSEATLCYLACNLELERGLTYLVNRLQAAGVMDKTVIVLTGDHFPYGLSENQYSELVDWELDDFSKYKGTFICWNPAMEPVQVDEYCCNVDILPTLLNLFGFSYDSRLLAGTDVLSDGQHMAILTNQSFLTEDVWFNSTTGEATWLKESARDDEYLDALISYVKNKFTISTAVLNTSYYDFVFHHRFVTTDDSGNVTVTQAVPIAQTGSGLEES